MGFLYKHNLVFKIKKPFNRVKDNFYLLNIQIVFQMVRRYDANNYLLPCNSESNPSASDIFL